MRAIFVILPLCLLITLSIKRVGNFYDAVDNRTEVQSEITNSDKTNSNRVNRHRALKNNYTVLALSDDDTAIPPRYRLILSGMSCCSFLFIFKNYIENHTGSKLVYVHSLRRPMPYNKGSPKRKIASIQHFLLSIQNNHCLFTFLQFLIAGSLKARPNHSFYLATIYLQSFFLIEILYLNIWAGHSFSKMPTMPILGASIFETLLFPP